MGYYCPSTNQGTLPYRNAPENCGVASDRGARLDPRPHQCPITQRLQLTVLRYSLRIAVVYKHNAVAYEDPVFDLDPFTDEAMARDLAVMADCRTLLDFHERADLRSVADNASIQVNQFGMENLHAFPQHYVFCDHCDPLSSVASWQNLLACLPADCRHSSSSYPQQDISPHH